MENSTKSIENDKETITDSVSENREVEEVLETENVIDGLRVETVSQTDEEKPTASKMEESEKSIENGNGAITDSVEVIEGLEIHEDDEILEPVSQTAEEKPTASKMEESEKSIENGNGAITDSVEVSEGLKNPEDEEVPETEKVIDGLRVETVRQTDEEKPTASKMEESEKSIENGNGAITGSVEVRLEIHEDYEILEPKKIFDDLTIKSIIDQTDYLYKTLNMVLEGIKREWSDLDEELKDAQHYFGNLTSNITSSFERLVNQIKRSDPDKVIEDFVEKLTVIIQIFNDLWMNQVQFQDLQFLIIFRILQKNEINKNLLADLKKYHLLEIKQLKEEFVQGTNLTDMQKILRCEIKLDALENTLEPKCHEIEKLRQELNSLITIQNIQSEELRKTILENDQMRHKLLTDLENQEESHLHEIEKLKQQCDIEIINLTNIQNIQTEEFEKEIFEKDQILQKLLIDLKDQKESHLVEIEKQKQQFGTEIVNLICRYSKQAEDFEILKKDQMSKETHLAEIEKLKEECIVTCCICLDPWTLSDGHRLVALACGHLFGESCIRESLERNEVCPQCRASASVDDILRLYGPR